jgi:hypothetical protein
VGKPELERPLRRQRSRWKDDIKVDLIGIQWVGMDWIFLTQDRDLWRTVVNMTMNLRVP